MIPVYEDEDYKISKMADSGYMVFKLAKFEDGVEDSLNTEVIYDSTTYEWGGNSNIDRLPDKIKQELLKAML